MLTEVHWLTIALRLILTVLAGSLLGMERSRNGHPAGLRTTLLVTLAASVSMIQMNLLIPTNGKPPNSYAVMDLMRLPLGILTGVGFIGAGAIIKKGDLVLGMTTAATLWFATVVGLCLGGGQLVLGSAATVLGYGVLAWLRRMEQQFEKFQPATLEIVLIESEFSPDHLRTQLEAAQCKVRSISVEHFPARKRQRIVCELRWPTDGGPSQVPPLLQTLQQTPGLVRLGWRATGK
jgi:putative Mg2+ transporter-C (MgtC) family protein